MWAFGFALTVTAAAYVWTAHGASAQSNPEPMIFFVAKGEPDACGPGCNEWIAAEGMFDGPDVERRFRDVLSTVQGRNLPIVFNSLGGVIGEALVLGRLLRERRIAASIGESYPEGCTARIAADESCRRIMQANRELKAKLRTAGADCASACVYAFVGASTRQVPPDARLGIHGSRPTPASARPGAPTPEQLINARKRYVLEMGVDPGLVDATSKVPSDSLHRLSRSEIAQFGIETRGAYETPWMLYQDSRISSSPIMMKSITQARGTTSQEYRTSNFRVTCAPGRPETLIEYKREAISTETNVPTAIRIAIGADVRTLQRGTPARGDDRYSTIADLQFIPKALAAGAIVITETFSPRNARSWSREIRFPTTGLAQALHTPLGNCPAT
jgi:hypothetical protein